MNSDLSSENQEFINEVIRVYKKYDKFQGVFIYRVNPPSQMDILGIETNIVFLPSSAKKEDIISYLQEAIDVLKNVKN
jgi:hypothetical protein